MVPFSPYERTVCVEILSDARWWDIYTYSEYLAFAELVLASKSLGHLNRVWGAQRPSLVFILYNKRNSLITKNLSNIGDAQGWSAAAVRECT
jgi:hypothetical protein